MSKFLSNMIELGIEAIIGTFSSKKKIEKAKEPLSRLIVNNEEIDVEEFLEMYDTRIHNFNTKQDDIKILKRSDFEGVYIIHNCTKNIFLVGKSKRVLRKVDRQFRGFENEDVYTDYENNDVFKIRIIKLKSSNYSNIEALEQDMKKKYGDYTQKKTQVKENEINTEKNNDIKVIFLAFGFLIIVMLLCFFMSYLYSIPKKGEIKVTINPEDYIGMNYQEVEKKFIDMGFTNVKSIPNEDLITGWINKEGETDKITIDNSDFNKDDIFSENAEVIITYHSFRVN